MTIVLPTGSLPAFLCLISPARPAADEGSTKMPSFAAIRRYAARISLSVTESITPPDRSRASTACAHDAGLPMRIAVAMVSGFFTIFPLTIGAAPAAWKPYICGNFDEIPSARYSL